MPRSSSNYRRFDVIEVTWVDSEEDSKWVTYEEYEARTPPVILTVGFLYEMTPDRVVVIQSLSEDVLDRGVGLMDSVLNIPKCSINDIRIIRKHNPRISDEHTYRDTSTKRPKGRLR